MPITKKHFELGITPEIGSWMKKIYDFLAKHNEAAYTERELADALGVIQIYSGSEYEKEYEKRKLFDKALAKLLEIDCVESREIHSIFYLAKGRYKLQDFLPE